MTTTESVPIPAAVTAMAGRGPRWARWVDTLPATVSALIERWDLVIDGPATHGHCSLVAPVRTADDGAAMLKVGFPDEDSAHEHLALRSWAGDGAVRLLAADPPIRALLLERLGPEDLNTVTDTEACRIVAGLYGRIHRPPLPQARSLAALVEGWTDDLRRLPRSAPIPRRLVEQAIALGPELTAGGGPPDRLLHTDLHYSNVLRANVLSATREPWLVIDPKPVNGDPHYEIAPMLWNRFTEMTGGQERSDSGKRTGGQERSDAGKNRGDVRAGVRRRLWTLVDAAGFDEDRARAWALIRMVHNAMWELDSPHVDRDWLTVCIAVAKAVQG